MTIPGKLKIKIIPNTVAAGDSVLIAGSAGDVKKGTVTLSVSGTTNRITVTGGANAIVDISASYSGQSSIITLGTIVSGIWHGTPIADAYIASSATWNGKQDPLTFANGLTNTANTVKLGGSITGNTSLSLGGFNFILDQSTTANIQQWKKSGSEVAAMSSDGQLFAAGISNLLTGNNAQVSTSTNGIFISRNVNDSHATLTVKNYNTVSTADNLRVNGSADNVLQSIGYNGLMTTNAYIPTATGFGRTKFFNDVLQPTANGDLLVGLDLRPVFGASFIASVNTLVGGSGYGTGTYNVMLTGGTGTGATATLTASAGGIVSVSLLNKGVNYTPADVLGATVLDATGTPIGSGFSVNVATITSYSGLTNYALRTYGLDQYDSDYSSTYSTRSKVDKGYSDTHSAGVSLTTTTTAPIPFPKMTTTQKNAIGTPVEGMVVYDTTLHQISYYNASTWINL